MRGTIRSRPINATCTRGIDVDSRMLPSFSSSTIVPVSATARFTPLRPMSARTNSSRSRRRASRVSASTSSVGRVPSLSAKSRATSPRDMCRAGAMMCDGAWPASWTMYSPRSVSIALMPAAARASLRWISSDTIDFPLTTRRTPCRVAISSTMRRASPAVAARWTMAPRLVAWRSNVARCSSSRAIVCCRTWRPRSRSASQSGTAATAAARRSVSLAVAASSRRASDGSAMAARARSARLIDDPSGAWCFVLGAWRVLGAWCLARCPPPGPCRPAPPSLVT